MPPHTPMLISTKREREKERESAAKRERRYRKLSANYIGEALSFSSRFSASLTGNTIGQRRYARKSLREYTYSLPANEARNYRSRTSESTYVYHVSHKKFHLEILRL